jgi:hypothetical protein
MTNPAAISSSSMSIDNPPLNLSTTNAKGSTLTMNIMGTLLDPGYLMTSLTAYMVAAADAAAGGSAATNTICPTQARR